MLVEAKSERVPPETEMSASAKLEVASLVVNVSASVPSLDVSPSDTSAAVIVTVGWVLSIVTEVASVTAVTAVPAFPASSLNAIENVTTPSASSSAMSTSQVQASLPASVTVTDPAKASPLASEKVHVGEEIVSPA